MSVTPPDATIRPLQRPVDRLTVRQHRGRLTHTLQRLAEGAATIGFVGGSITDARPGHNWPGPVVAWLVDRFPNVRFAVENAAIGSTGSDLAVFRADRDLIDRGCDLVFVEYAVNDAGVAVERRNRTREGLLRKLLRGSACDVVLVYAYCREMYEDMMAGSVPASISEFDVMAKHYGLGSVWMGLHALREMLHGQMSWEAWLPDGLHPLHRGSQSYAESVVAFLDAEFRDETQHDRGQRTPLLPPPLNPHNWEHAVRLPIESVQTEGPWAFHRWPRNEWIDRVLATSVPGAKLHFVFEGRSVSLGYDFGKTSADFCYRIDGKAWHTVRQVRPDWCANDGEFWMTVLADDLAPGQHEVDVEVIRGGEGAAAGSHFRLAFIGIVDAK